FKTLNQFINDIIDILKRNFHSWVVYLNWQIMSNVVTESGNYRIIIWLAPFSIKIGKSVNIDWYIVSYSIFKNIIFASFFALTIRIILFSLDRRGNHDRGLIIIFLQQIG